MSAKTKRLIEQNIEQEAEALAEHILNTDRAVLDRAREIIIERRILDLAKDILQERGEKQ